MNVRPQRGSAQGDKKYVFDSDGDDFGLSSSDESSSGNSKKFKSSAKTATKSKPKPKPKPKPKLVVPHSVTKGNTAAKKRVLLDSDDEDGIVDVKDSTAGSMASSAESPSVDSEDSEDILLSLSQNDGLKVTKSKLPSKRVVKSETTSEKNSQNAKLSQSSIAESQDVIDLSSPISSQTSMTQSQSIAGRSSNISDSKAKQSNSKPNVKTASSAVPLRWGTVKPTVLMQLTGSNIDLSGDTGVVGRVKATSGGLEIDLKGILFNGQALPCCSVAVVNVGKTEAKIEGIASEVVHLTESKEGAGMETWHTGSRDMLNNDGDESDDGWLPEEEGTNTENSGNSSGVKRSRPGEGAKKTAVKRARGGSASASKGSKKAGNTGASQGKRGSVSASKKAAASRGGKLSTTKRKQ